MNPLAAIGGPIGAHLVDPRVSEIVVNGHAAVFVEIDGRLERTGGRFHDDGDLRRTIVRLAGLCGRRVDDASPIVDARLPDGSRLNAVLPPLAVDGPLLTIRRFPERLRLTDLVELGTLDGETARLLAEEVHARRNLLVSGATSTGKTTLLAALAECFDPIERVVTVEDAAELRLALPHVARLEARPAAVDGRGAVDLRALVRNALRMRPDRLIVGEVRGAEALDLLMALNTGHDGSLTTVHANGPGDALRRIETMALMSGVDLPHAVVREQTARAVQAIVHLERGLDGHRRVASVSRVVEMEGSWSIAPLDGGIRAA